MKKLVLLVLLLSLTGMAVLLHAADPVEPPASCQYCGMDRTKFAHSRMLLKYEDGTTVGTCSINCAAIDLKEKAGSKATSIQVADYNSKQLIDAKTANWVMGGDKKGVMTMLPKWAFAKPEDAQSFIKVSGGKPATYEEALKAAGENPKRPMMKKSEPAKDSPKAAVAATDNQPATGGCNCGCQNCAMQGKGMMKGAAQAAGGCNCGCQNCAMKGAAQPAGGCNCDCKCGCENCAMRGKN